MARNLTPQETLNLCCGLVKRSRMPAENINRLKNYIIPRAKEMKSSEHQSVVDSSKSSCSKATQNAREHHRIDVSSAPSCSKATQNAREQPRTVVSSANCSSMGTQNAREQPRTVVSSANGSSKGTDNVSLISKWSPIPHHKVTKLQIY